MDKLLETHKLLKLKQEKIKNVNTPITSKEIESVIKKFPTQKAPGTNDLFGEFKAKLGHLGGSVG